MTLIPPGSPPPARPDRPTDQLPADRSADEAAPSDAQAPPTSAVRNAVEVAGVFLKLGAVGFGGPAALTALMEDEVVRRRQWLSRERFLDLVGATNLIPGPNAVELAIHIGLLRAGWLGFALAGLGFIAPATAVCLALACAYVQFGSLPDVEGLLAGIKPAILAVVAGAVWRLATTAVRSLSLAAVAGSVAALAAAGVNEVATLLGGAVVGMVWLRYRENRSPRTPDQTLGCFALPAAALGNPATGGLMAASATGLGGAGIAAGPPVWQLGLFFLKVGAVLYGSGYVLVAFLQGGLVEQYGWLTHTQLLDAIAIGQFTPGPLLSTVTFVGYLLAGLPGAIVATVAVFTPSFIFVPVVHRLLPRLRQSPWPAAFLDAVNASAVALMAVVAVKLAAQALVDWPAWLIALAALIASLRLRVNPALLVIGGAAAGWLLHVGR